MNAILNFFCVCRIYLKLVIDLATIDRIERQVILQYNVIIMREAFRNASVVTCEALVG